MRWNKQYLDILANTCNFEDEERCMEFMEALYAVANRFDSSSGFKSVYIYSPFYNCGFVSSVDSVVNSVLIKPGNPLTELTITELTLASILYINTKLRSLHRVT